jgi:hypothetical protein
MGAETKKFAISGDLAANEVNGRASRYEYTSYGLIGKSRASAKSRFVTRLLGLLFARSPGIGPVMKPSIIVELG